MRTPRRQWVVAASLALAAVAEAQQPSTGVFDGQGPPAADAAWRTAVTARPENVERGTKRAAAAVLFTTNPSPANVWVTVYRDGGVHASGCMRSGSSKSWPLGGAPGRWTVRAEISRNNDCLPPVACETTIELQPNMSALEITDVDRRCRWLARVPAQVADGQRTTAPAGSCLYYRRNSELLAVSNPDAARAIWVTLYRNAPEPGKPSDAVRDTHESACIEPGETRDFCVPAIFRDSTDFGYHYWIRAERGRKGGCKRPIACDTVMELDWKRPLRLLPKGKAHVSLTAGEKQSCRWQWNQGSDDR